ncbi:diguanylate cyclase [Povalibacter sp.]|uniref:sensor domain-containing diguanylate cyclase n=1 Tax=Povalibacter sp. TaxID=1962978 RepID=UPI002F40B346
MSRFPLLLFIVLLQWLTGCSDAQAQGGAAPVTLENRWSYQWENPQHASNAPRWQSDGADWVPTVSPANPPGRADHLILWLKLDLPSGEWRDPHLFISSVDFNIAIFDRNGRRLYQFGEFDAEGRGRFSGWPWHLISLPQADLGQPIYLRVFSDYRDIGLAGDVLVGERADLLQRVFSRGFVGIAFAIVVFLVGLISMCLGLIKRDRPMAIATGMLSFDLALMMFAENELNQLVAFAPLFWRQLAAYTYFMVPALLAGIMLAWFRTSPPRSAYAVIAVSMTFVLGILGLSTLGSFSFVNAYPVFDVLFISLVLVLLVDGALHLRPVNLESGLMVGGISLVFISLLVDMASASGLIPWIGRAGQWGLACFALSSLGMYLVRDWRQQHELRRLQHSLEQQVEERTRELTASQEKLLQLAHEDPLTGLLNRRAFMTHALQITAQAMRHGEPLALVLFDVDHFKTFNDQHGHAVGDEVLRAIADVVRSNSRAGDLLCRYGGEEFVMLMPHTSAEAAQISVERLRVAIAGLEVQGLNGRVLSVSVSIGLVVLSEPARKLQDPERMLDQILSQADAAMYQIKNSGRNGVNLTYGLWSADTGAWTARQGMSR